MSIIKVIFIPLSIALLTACSLKNTPTPELISQSDSEPTPQSALVPTEILPTNTAQAASPTAVPAAEPTEPSGNQPDADVIHVRAVLGVSGSWTFYVTVEHPDTGWDDYADGWDVVAPDGTILKVDPDDSFTRLLAHPHVNEQPFTRFQSGILIPDGITLLTVRAHDILDGFGGQEILVDLEEDSGPGFEVER
ncbi:MAG: hypothetical protein ABFS03_13255 [Chloroflexota bacterium]